MKAPTEAGAKFTFAASGSRARQRRRGHAKLEGKGHDDLVLAVALTPWWDTNEAQP